MHLYHGRNCVECNGQPVKCRKHPKKVQQSAVFLIDLRYTSLEHLRADGLSQYEKYGGERNLTVEVDDDDMKVMVTSRAKENLKSKNKYHFERLYHSWNVGSEGNKFHKRSVHMKGRRMTFLTTWLLCSMSLTVTRRTSFTSLTKTPKRGISNPEN